MDSAGCASDGEPACYGNVALPGIPALTNPAFRTAQASRRVDRAFETFTAKTRALSPGGVSGYYGSHPKMVGNGVQPVSAAAHLPPTQKANHWPKT